MKSLIIAEKPSLAREIQNMLESSFNEKFISRGDYQESANYILSSFFGHLLEMAKPNVYNEKYKNWNLADLPILPETFIYEYKESSIKRGKLLKSLAEQCDSIINATDPDREGEGIFRTWYNYEKIRKPFKRLWATSLTLKDLTKAWNKLKDSKEYDNLSHAQESRAKADWLVGMNASRLYSVLTGDRCPVGRVKTATLALIVKRDFEVENYKESFLYSLTGTWGGFNFTYLDEDSNTRFEDKNFLETLLKRISKDKFSLFNNTKEEKKQNPPKTFSQPDLQKEADVKFGFSLDKTLEITQSLYEKKLVTYPRTDSPYLPESDLDEYYKLIGQLASPAQKNLLLPTGTKPACVKNSDSPHTAIVPTGHEPSGLSDYELKLYELIKERFITAFMKPKVYDEYTFVISNGSEKFRSIIKSVKDYGFQGLYKTSDEEDDIQEVEKIDESKILNLSSEIEGLVVNAIKKAKPKYFTPATLLTAMMNAGKTLEDKESREIMGEVEGLGTAATRQLYPVELEKDGYIEKKGKNLISVSKGRKLIELITPELKSVEKTAELEKKLRLIESGSYSYDQYRTEINSYVTSFVQAATENKDVIESSFGVSRQCPKCGKPLTRLKCNSCDFIFYTKIAGKLIEQKYIDQLFNDFKTDTIKGFQGKEKTFDARLKFDEDFKVVFDFEKESLGNCNCGGQITESLKAYNCSKCKRTVWKEFLGKKITIKQAVALLQNQKVLVKGLKGKSEKTFDANLYLDAEGKIKFEFSKK